MEIITNWFTISHKNTAYRQSKDDTQIHLFYLFSFIFFAFIFLQFYYSIGDPLHEVALRLYSFTEKLSTIYNFFHTKYEYLIRSFD